MTEKSAEHKTAWTHAWVEGTDIKVTVTSNTETLSFPVDQTVYVSPVTRQSTDFYGMFMFKDEPTELILDVPSAAYIIQYLGNMRKYKEQLQGKVGSTPKMTARVGETDVDWHQCQVTVVGEEAVITHRKSADAPPTEHRIVIDNMIFCGIDDNRWLRIKTSNGAGTLTLFQTPDIRMDFMDWLRSQLKNGYKLYNPA